MGKRYYEVEFGVWVEEPDPLRKPACDALWPDEWDYDQGTRPRCFRPEGHEGEHRETRRLVGGEGWMEYFWGSEPGSGRSELRDEGPEPESDPTGTG
jgi:hypothetical protein